MSGYEGTDVRGFILGMVVFWVKTAVAFCQSRGKEYDGRYVLAQAVEMARARA